MIPEAKPIAGSSTSEYAVSMSRLLTAFIMVGLAFMLLPGTFLGVWNLIAISSSEKAGVISPAWIQAHGQAQIFGWIGSFILGIGFHSIPKLRRQSRFPVWVGWTTLGLWTAGVLLRWIANVYGLWWRALLPVSALMQIAAFAFFFRAVLGNHVAQPEGASSGAGKPAWMLAIMAGAGGFAALLLSNFAGTMMLAMWGAGPAFPKTLDSGFLALASFGFLVPHIWGFSARWLPVFMGLRPVCEKGLKIALAADISGVLAIFAGAPLAGSLLLALASIAAVAALGVFSRPVQPAKVLGVHPTLPRFLRLAYIWLLAAVALGVCAEFLDHNNGFHGAARHALTVGFIATMVFCIGQRVLPAFTGMKLLFSPRVMFVSLLLLNAGCLLRVSGEVLAYENYAPIAWHLLPASACIELAAVTLFALNLLLTFRQPPAHELVRAAAA